jgi:hypothetical protein
VQNYVFLFKQKFFPCLFPVFYEAIPAVRCNLPKKKSGGFSIPSGLKKNRLVVNKQDG